MEGWRGGVFFFFLQPTLPTHPSTQTLIDKFVSGVVYWAIGFAFAYGDTAGGVIGRSGFFLAHATPEALALWFSSWTFFITATTIVSGCLAERAAFGAYLAHTPVVSGLAFPLAVHWAFHGWLSDAPCAYIDFAGGSTVHLLGGTAGLAAALLVGPRLGRFDDGGGGSSSGGRWRRRRDSELPPPPTHHHPTWRDRASARLRSPPIAGHNVESVALGTLALWFGWYGFNVAPAFLRGSDRTAVALRAAVNTTLAACTACLASLALRAVTSASLDLRTACNGVLGGIVAATGLAAYVDPWAAALVGAVAGAALVASAAGLAAAGVDDPLDSVPVHAVCGAVGIVSAGLFAKPDLLAAYRGASGNNECGGVFYAGGRAGGTQLGVQIGGALAIGGLSAALAAATFGALRAAGRLRVDTAAELAGIDHVDHGGPAYPDFELKTRE